MYIARVGAHTGDQSSPKGPLKSVGAGAERWPPGRSQPRTPSKLQSPWAPVGEQVSILAQEVRLGTRRGPGSRKEQAGTWPALEIPSEMPSALITSRGHVELRAGEEGERRLQVPTLAPSTCGPVSLEFRFCYRLNCAPPTRHPKNSEAEVLTPNLSAGSVCNGVSAGGVS